jgi:cyanobactin maturation PatA/PatG family protease
MATVELDAEWEARLPGLARLRARSSGHPGIRIAILDGPVHPATAPPGLIAPSGVADHGTLVASIAAGSRTGPRLGIAPGCTVLSIPIFREDETGALLLCSQGALAAAIREAVSRGAKIVNISASQQTDLLSLETELSAALQEAIAADVLIVAAAGNDGCACDAIPASCPGVLPVGAHDGEGRPLARSNWGMGQRTGILAPGEGLPGACAGDGVCRGTGTSFAAALVSGVAALAMSIWLQRGEKPSGAAIRRLLVETADPCPAGQVESCAPYLAGRLNVDRLADRILSATEKVAAEVTVTAIETMGVPGMALAPAEACLSPASELPASVEGLAPAHEGCSCGGKCGGKPEAGCSCQAKGKAPARPQLVYAIGRVGISFISQARRDSIWRSINGTVAAPKTDLDFKPITNEGLLDLFRREPWHAQSVIWTLSRSEVPMYAIVPSGPFAAETYEWLVDEWADRDVEFVSLPGVIAGQITLYDGLTIDAVVPDPRGMFSWNTKQYVDALVTQMGGADGDAAVAQRIDRFLRKIYFQIRNRGLAPEERALNAAATNAFNLSDIVVQAGSEGLAFRGVSVERSPLNRPGSEYYDVLLTFFDPGRRQDVAPLVARFTVDVSDTVPVVVGERVTWYEY